MTSLAPFRMQVLGVGVTVGSVNLTKDDQIVALCCRGQPRQAIPILEALSADNFPLHLVRHFEEGH